MAALSIDAHILRALFTQPGAYISGTSLAESRGISRAAIWKHIEQLGVLGYEIEAQPHYGYRLRHATDILCADEIIARLPDPRPGDIPWQPIVFKETSSTMDLAAREAHQGAAAGLLMLAEKQTSGRGRRGRSWESTSGLGLYASLLLRPDWPPTEITRLTIVSALAIAEAVEQLLGHRTQIKWPNDIFIRGRKLGGILTEVQCEPEHIRSAVLGFGLNVNHEPEDLSAPLRSLATSLRIESGSSWRRVDLLIAVLDHFQRRWRQSFAQVREDWSVRCLSLGKSLRIQTSHGEQHGQALGLDETGALLLRTGSGAVERISSGDIH